MIETDLKRLREFFVDAPYWAYQYGRISKLAGISEDLMAAVREGLGLMLATGEMSSGDDYWPYHPIWVMDGRVSALPPKQVAAEILACWADIANSVPEPAAVGRFADLLWVVRQRPRPDAYARAAIEAYFQLAEGDWSSAGDGLEGESPKWAQIHRAECLARALAISSELRDGDLQGQTITVMLAAIGQVLQAPSPLGVIYTLLEPLAKLPPSTRPPELQDIVAQVQTLSRNSRHVTERLYELAVSLESDDEGRRAVRTQQVERWVELADATEGLGRLMNLTRALELARQYGVHDVDELRRRIDRLDPEELDLSPISVKVEVSAEKVDQFLDGFVTETWQDSLAMFGSSGGSSPSGDVDDNQAILDEFANEFPLQSIIPTTIIDDGGRPIRHSRTPEELRTGMLLRQEVMGISLWSHWSVDILARIFFTLRQTDSR